MKDKNYLMYFVTIGIVTCCYVIIYLFFNSSNIDNWEYEYNLPKQPVNNIYSIKKSDSGNDNGNGSDNGNKGNNGGKKNDGEDNGTTDDEDDDSKIVFTYDQDVNNYISIHNQFPIADSVGINRVGDKYTNDFKLKFNKLAQGVKYTITLEKLPESDLSDDWLKVYLSSDGVGVSDCYRNDGKVKTYNEYGNYQDRSDERVLHRGTVTYADTLRGYKDFTLKLWISEDVKVSNGEYLSKTSKVRINIYAEK